MQTFTPADIDASQSSAAFTVYSKTTGSKTESLTISKPGTSGALTYKYVGSGYWQRVTTSGDHADFTFDAFSYGVKTPDAAIPRVGTALYSIDLVGALGFGIPVALSGSGTMQLDFGSGVLIASGTIKQISIENGSTIGGPSAFLGTGRVSTSTNLFNGSFSYEVGTGTMQGRFYGPAADEVGAVFATTYPDGRAAVGTITGRKTGSLGGNTSFDSSNNTQFYANDAAVLRATYSGSAPSAESAGEDALIVNYNAATNSYTLMAADGSRVFATAFSGGNGSDKLVIQPSGGLRYVRSALWTRTGAGGAFATDAFTYGFETPGSAVPRTGTGLFPVTLVGNLTDPTQSGAPLDLSGAGLFTANFGTGAIDVSGDVTATYLPLSGRPPAVTGSFSGSGTITSGTNRFGGAFTIDVLGHHVGSFLGRFYGPNTDEIGAEFYGKSSTDGNVVVGSLYGAGIPNVPLSAINRNTDMSRLYGYFDYYYSPTNNNWFGGQAFPSEGNQPYLVYDPGAPAAIATYNNEVGTLLSFGSGDRVAAASGAGVDVYRKTVDGKDYETRIYNPSGSGAPLALTYTSYATLFIKTPADPAVPNSLEVNKNYTYVIGSPMSPLLAPRSGSATYSGIVAGRGLGPNGSGPPIFDLTGTSNLAVDFGAGTARTTLLIQGTNLSSGAFKDFGSFVFNGQTGNFSFGVGSKAGFGFTGGAGTFFQGFFYGQNAEEFGATFTVAGGGGTLVGVAVGKKN